MWTTKGLIFLQLIAVYSVLGEQLANEIADKNEDKQVKPIQGNVQSAPVQEAKMDQGLEARGSDRGFIKDILDRLHALDADIGKLLYNQTAMYAPADPNQAFAENSRGGEKFTEVLNDLDSLQDEVST